MVSQYSKADSSQNVTCTWFHYEWFYSEFQHSSFTHIIAFCFTNHSPKESLCRKYHSTIGKHSKPLYLICILRSTMYICILNSLLTAPVRSKDCKLIHLKTALSYSLWSLLLKYEIKPLQREVGKNIISMPQCPYNFSSTVRIIISFILWTRKLRPRVLLST